MSMPISSLRSASTWRMRFAVGHGLGADTRGLDGNGDASGQKNANQIAPNTTSRVMMEKVMK